MNAAWAYLMRQAPMMANPMEYREALWSILHGDPPPVTRKRDADGKPAAPRALPVARRAPNKAEWNRLEEFNRHIEEVKARRASSPPEPPVAT